MQDIINYFNTIGLNVESHSEGGLEKIEPYKIDYNKDILTLENDIKKSLNFYPYITTERIKRNNKGKETLFNDLNNFNSNRKTPKEHQLFIEPYLTGSLSLKPYSGDIAGLVECDFEKQSLYAIYQKEFTDFAKFIKNK